MPNKCICHDLHVVVTVSVLFLFFFYFSFVCRNSMFQVNRTNDATGEQHLTSSNRAQFLSVLQAKNDTKSVS